MGLARSLLAILAFSGLSIASPIIEKRQKSYLKPTYEQILNYALTLEHLEATFYGQGVANFTADDFKAAGYSLSIYKQIQTIANDEASHVSFLTKALQCKLLRLTRVLGLVSVHADRPQLSMSLPFQNASIVSIQQRQAPSLPLPASSKAWASPPTSARPPTSTRPRI